MCCLIKILGITMKKIMYLACVVPFCNLAVADVDITVTATVKSALNVYNAMNPDKADVELLKNTGGLVDEGDRTVKFSPEFDQRLNVKIKSAHPDTDKCQLECATDNDKQPYTVHIVHDGATRTELKHDQDNTLDFTAVSGISLIFSADANNFRHDPNAERKYEDTATLTFSAP